MIRPGHTLPVLSLCRQLLVLIVETIPHRILLLDILFVVIGKTFPTRNAHRVAPLLIIGFQLWIIIHHRPKYLLRQVQCAILLNNIINYDCNIIIHGILFSNQNTLLYIWFKYNDSFIKNSTKNQKSQYTSTPKFTPCIHVINGTDPPPIYLSLHIKRHTAKIPPAQRSSIAFWTRFIIFALPKKRHAK